MHFPVVKAACVCIRFHSTAGYTALLTKENHQGKFIADQGEKKQR